MLFSRYLGILLLISQAQSLVIVDSSIASACIYYMKQFDWGCGGTGQGHKYYLCRCGNVDWLGSVASCISGQTNNKGKIDHALKHVTTRCLQKGHFHYTVDDMKQWRENATKYIEQPTAHDIKERLYHPLGVNQTDFAVYMRSFDEINHHVFKSQWLGWGLLYYWVAVVVIFAMLHLLQIYLGLRPPRRIAQFCEKYLTPVRLWGYSFLDIVVMGLFLVFTVLATALSYTVQLPNVYMNDVYFLTLDLIGYRSAIISFSLLPVVFIFGLRNNPFTFLTGLPRATFIKYHNYVAIIMSIEALIHSAVWTDYAINEAGYLAWSIDDYWRWGIVGTVLLFIMIGQSFQPVRNFMYEAFLVIHIVFGWLFIVAMWYHCVTLGWMGWVYTMIALTVYDRVMRWAKILVLNRGLTELYVTVVDERTLELTLPKPLAYDMSYRPGSSVYVTFLHSKIWSQCLQSHPFSIISSPATSSNVLKMYVRVKRGATRSLLRLPADEKGRLRLWCLLDGPYGGFTYKHRDSDDRVYIAGGLGVCSLLPHVYSNPAGAKLIWTVANAREFWCMRRDINYVRERGTEVTVYVRDPSGIELDDEKMLFVQPADRRPDFDELIGEHVKAAKADKKRDLCIYSCGPGNMDRQIKQIATRQIEVGLDFSVHHKSMNYQW